MTVRRLRRHAGNQAAGWAQSAILISKMVLSTVNLGPPEEDRTTPHAIAVIRITGPPAKFQ